jgi:3-methyladenine DNA glycosylase Mpg
MENLKQILSNGRGDDDYKELFSKIAEELIYRCHISAPEATYRIREIEFYYNSHNHQDPTVYGIIQAKHKNGLRMHRHKKRQSSQFTWFIHYRGIDIVFGEGETPAGILIRAVERIGENSFADEYIDGTAGGAS